MVATLPDDAAIQDFNSALLLKGEDVDPLRSMTFRLGALYRRGSRIAGLGLLHCHTMLGEVEAARHIADEFWWRKAALPPDLRLKLSQLLTRVGAYERAVTLLADTVDLAHGRAGREWAGVAIEAMLVQWDAKAVALAESISGDVARIVDAVEAAGMLPHMTARQDAVNALLLPVQCGCRTEIVSDGDDQVRLVRLVYVAGSYSERRALSDRVSEAVTRWCERCGVDEGSARTLLSEVILPVTARGAVDETAILEEL